jgi:hypothetical protein
MKDKLKLMWSKWNRHLTVGLVCGIICAPIGHYTYTSFENWPPGEKLLLAYLLYEDGAPATGVAVLCDGHEAGISDVHGMVHIPNTTRTIQCSVAQNPLLVRCIPQKEYLPFIRVDLRKNFEIRLDLKSMYP